MKTFSVLVPEIFYQWYKVMAEDEDEAKTIIKDYESAGIPVGLMKYGNADIGSIDTWLVLEGSPGEGFTRADLGLDEDE